MLDRITFVSYAAAALGIVSLVICGILVPTILSEIGNVWTEIDTNSAEFKAAADVLWDEMIRLYPAGSVRASRQQYLGPNGGAASVGGSASGIPAGTGQSGVQVGPGPNIAPAGTLIPGGKAPETGGGGTFGVGGIGSFGGSVAVNECCK